jgi:hypothetical protein
MAKSIASANLVLNFILGGAAATAPSARYLSLHTGDPGSTGASEATGSGYSRQAVTWNAAAAKAATNSNALSQTLSGALGPITFLGVWDASTAGTFLYGLTVTSAKTYANGDSWTVAIGALTLTEN